MGVDCFRYRLPFVANNLFDDLIVNPGHGQHTDASMAGIMWAVVHSHLLNQRHPVGIIIIAVYKVLCIRSG